MSLGQEEAERLFDDQIRAVISQSVKEPFDIYRNAYPPAVRAVHTKRTKASILRDHMVDCAIRGFSGISGASTVAKRGYVLIHVRGKALLRFKKLSRGSVKLARNYPTSQARDFASNLPMLIRGLPEETRFDVGYSLNQDGTWWETISISCPGLEPYSFDIEMLGGSGYLGTPTAPPPEITPAPTGETTIRSRGSQDEKDKRSNRDGAQGD